MIPSSSFHGLWRIRRWCAAGILACTAFALFFLLKGENSSWFSQWYDSQAGEMRHSGEYHVSAFTYYFVWSQSQRDGERKREEALSDLQVLSRAYHEDLPGAPETFRDKMVRNMRIAAILILVSLFLAIANVILNFRSRESVPQSADPFRRQWY